MDAHDRLLQAFLAGDMGQADAQRFDDHLLECEACWRAVREDRAGRQAAHVLREPAPAGLADRVTFAVEVAGSAHTAPQRPARAAGRSRWPLAGAGVLAAGVLVTLIGFLLPGRSGPAMPAAVAAVAHYAQAVPSPTGPAYASTGRRVSPAQVGHSVTVIAGGQRILLRTWRLGGTEAVVAVSRQPFPMPAGAAAASGGGMAWSARLGKLRLYCINGRTSELVAAPVPAAELARLAARLPLA
jgi:hypothetical protein